jgi:D-amino peptidase
MKLYISVDMEGIGGVAGSWQVMQEPGALDDVRQRATGEVNAAIEGALEAGATTVYVNENHSGRDLILEEVHPAAEVLVGKPKPLMTLDDLDESFAGVFLIGIHARIGTERAVMDHTWGPKTVQELRVNDTPIGEIGLNALLAGESGVPVALCTGDDKAMAEARQLLGDVETVTVKVGLDRYAARCKHRSVVEREIKQAAERTMRDIDRFRPFSLGTPVVMEIDWATTIHAEWASQIPTSQRTGPRTVRWSCEDFFAAMRIFNVANMVAWQLEDPMF